MAMTDSKRWQEVQGLQCQAKTDRVFNVSLIVVIGICLRSWLVLDINTTHPVTGRSRLGLKPSFLNDAIPFPLRATNETTGETTMAWDTGTFFRWVGDTWSESGWEAILDTVSLSVLAIVLAAIGAAVLVLPASRNVMLRGGFLGADQEISGLEYALRRSIFMLARGILLVTRAVPEFIWAFVLLGVFGPQVICGVIALALHNAGIIGKLSSEVVEDMDQKTNVALAGMGASKSAVTLMGILPRAFPQFLVYFFYRWETCVRETAILGILAIQTMGFFIDHSFAFFHFDKALLFIVFNSLIVIIGDALGSLARRKIRQEGGKVLD